MAEERRDFVVADRTKAVCYSVASNKNKKKKVKKLGDTPKRKGVIGIGDCFGGHDSLYYVYKDSFQTLKPYVPEEVTEQEKTTN
ncbi:MAG: hypothetical protein II886_01985 [Prevotella sp.]|nr:hypothetical protein [Prevotella sp.]